MKLLSLAGLFILCCGTSFAQEPVMPDLPDAATALKLSRAQDAIEMVENELQPNSDLELIESQKIEIREIIAIHEDWMRLSDRIPPEKMSDKKYVNELVNEYRSELLSLGTRLTEKVLVPRQKRLLMWKVFARKVKLSDGDISKAITEYFPDKIELDAGRKEKLATISKTTKKEIEEARKKFKAELNRILQKGQKESLALFSVQEREILGPPLK